MVRFWFLLSGEFMFAVVESQAKFFALLFLFFLENWVDLFRLFLLVFHLKILQFDLIPGHNVRDWLILLQKIMQDDLAAKFRVFFHKFYAAVVHFEDFVNVLLEN